MKFRIESTKCSTEEHVLIKHYPLLKDFGYKDGYITVKNLKELMDLANKAGFSIILTNEHEIYDPKLKVWIGTGVPNIEIYDCYRE